MVTKKTQKMLSKTAIVLASVGALNWGLVQWLDFNLVTSLLGSIPNASAIVYTLVAISGAYALFDAFK